jgi:cytochrome c peroxidase
VLFRSRGFDLGIYRDGYGLIDAGSNERTQIVFLNDSMFYEEGTLPKIIDKMRSLPENVVYSILESQQYSRHIQSYFLFATLDSKSFPKLGIALNYFKNWRFKRSAVTLGEKKLITNLNKFGIDCKGLWSTEELKKIEDHNCQTCHLIEKMPDKYINPTTHLIHRLTTFDLFCKKFNEK